MSEKNLGEKLQSLPRQLLYLILFAATIIPLFVGQFRPITIPNQPVDSTMDLFSMLLEIPEGGTVVIQSDWTNSTRGESGGQFEALIRILMRRNIKFALYSGADPQAPQVARDVIRRLSEESQKEGGRAYQRWDDWVDLGYFPAGDAMNKAMATDLRKAFNGRKDAPAGGKLQDVFLSPVLKNVKKFGDLNAFVIVTASSSLNVAIERLAGKGTKMGAMITGVMGPEAQPYYSSGQLTGLSVGLKGVYDMETMMQYGINSPDKATAKVVSSKDETIPGFPGKTNFSKGSAYYPTLHVSLVLLILAVAIGNIGMALSKRRAA